MADRAWHLTLVPIAVNYSTGEVHAWDGGFCGLCRGRMGGT